MMQPNESLSLVDVLQEIRRTYGQPVTYNILWKLIAEGSIPAERVRGRWQVQRRDLARVAEALGIRPAA